jgi:hypothetical protein
VAAVLLTRLAAYAPTIDYPYLQDAVQAVKTNPVVARGDLGEIFTSHYWKATSSPAPNLYRPVTVLSFAMERKLTGGRPDPRVSRVINIVLHDLTAVLLFLYVRRLRGGLFAAGAAALLFVALRTYAIEDFPGLQQVLPLNNILVGMDAGPRLVTALAMSAAYGRLLVLPLGLSADYSGTAIERVSSLLGPAPLAGLLILGLLAVLMLGPPVLAARKGHRPLGAIEVVRDRMPRAARPIATIAVSVVVLIGVWQTQSVSRMWSSAEALFETSLRATPGILRSHFTLAQIREQQGRLDEAERALREALANEPRLIKAEAELGHLLFRQGRYADAAESYRRCVRAGREDLRPNLERAIASGAAGL